MDRGVVPDCTLVVNQLTPEFTVVETTKVRAVPELRMFTVFD
jgi:hypothetical protein